MVRTLRLHKPSDTGQKSSLERALDEHRAAFLDALLARDSARARRTIEDALAAGAPVPDLYLYVLDPALREVGHRWAMGAAQRRRGALRDRDRALDPRRAEPPAAPRAADGRLAVVSGTPGEQHVLGARMVADFLEADGWEVLLLGAGAPTDDLIALVERRAAGPGRALDRDRRCARRRRRDPRRAATALAAPVHRRRRAVLDARRPARPRSSSAPTWSSRTRASSSPSCTSGSRRRSRRVNIRPGGPDDAGTCSRCSTRRSRGWSRAARPASGARSRSRASRRGSSEPSSGRRAAGSTSRSRRRRAGRDHRPRRAPEWVEPPDRPELYIEALVTSRRTRARTSAARSCATRSSRPARRPRPPARGLLGGRARAGRLVRGPGLHEDEHVRRQGLAGPSICPLDL